MVVHTPRFGNQEFQRPKHLDRHKLLTSKPAEGHIGPRQKQASFVGWNCGYRDRREPGRLDGPAALRRNVII